MVKKRTPTKFFITASTVIFLVHAFLLLVCGFVLLWVWDIGALFGLRNLIVSIFKGSFLDVFVQDMMLTFTAKFNVSAVTVPAAFVLAIICIFSLGAQYTSAGKPLKKFVKKGFQRWFYFVCCVLYVVAVLAGCFVWLSDPSVAPGMVAFGLFMVATAVLLALNLIGMMVNSRNVCKWYKGLDDVQKEKADIEFTDMTGGKRKKKRKAFEEKNGEVNF